ncbi:hypothetical protein [Aridibaculum aurantiacum]|uniref:hypothetical protein n=1 Tax=Aridibaculum aurantiacum TaxID=2810307 RepID=UPI001A95B84F|nr:hypothetical protein [Aridibaculum aurantiacum]
MKKLLTSLLALTIVVGTAFSQTSKETKQKPATQQTEVRVKKDGTPDKRVKANKKLRKDGKPDMRFKQNKKD